MNKYFHSVRLAITAFLRVATDCLENKSEIVLTGRAGSLSLPSAIRKVLTKTNTKHQIRKIFSDLIKIVLVVKNNPLTFAPRYKKAVSSYEKIEADF